MTPTLTRATTTRKDHEAKEKATLGSLGNQEILENHTTLDDKYDGDHLEAIAETMKAMNPETHLEITAENERTKAGEQLSTPNTLPTCS